MKLTAKTIEILKNFSLVRGSIEVSSGNVLKTIRDDQSITARAITDQHFDTPFAIFDLNRFLNVISLMKSDVDIDFNKSYMVITSGKQQANYYYCDPSNIKTKNTKDEFFEGAKNLAPIISFDVPKIVMTQALKAGNVLQNPEISFVGDGKHIQIRAVNVENPLSDSYNVEIGESSVQFKATFSCVPLACLPSIDYNVRIRPGATLFGGDSYDYIIAMIKKHSNLAIT